MNYRSSQNYSHIDETFFYHHVYDQIIVASNKIEKVNPNPKNKDSIIANP